MRRRNLGLVVIFANAAIAALLAFARTRKAHAATLEHDDSSPAPAKAPSSSKAWKVPAGFRGVRASEITPELRRTAEEIATKLESVKAGEALTFDLEGKRYWVVRTKTGSWRYYVQKTPSEAAEDLPAPVPLPGGLTH